jgi:hypothetical protein
MKRTIVATLPLAFLPALALVPGTHAAQSTATLRGTVGPGFTITLKTAQGTLASRLNHGGYTIRIRDLSPIHNFHLFGPGVNKKTSVVGTGNATWTVMLERGIYHYQCDPHHTIMHGSFTVF